MLEPALVATIVLLVLATIALAFRQGSVSQVGKLSYQNKLLTALRHLDIVALPITEINPICQEIVDVIHGELGYFFGAIALVDTKADGLRRVAISDYPELKAVVKNLPIEYTKQIVSFSQKDNVLIQVFKTGKSIYTPRMYDVQAGIFPTNFSDDLQRTLQVKGLFVYPITAKHGTIGVIYYCTLVEKEKFSHFEFEVMEEFTREVSMVLDNVFLYQNLKEASKELAAANKKLQELDQLKDDFVSVASHELRTPMTAIRSYSWLALYRPDIELSEKMKKYLSRVLISTERLINLVNDMLNVSRIEAGRIEVRPQIFDIQDLVEEVTVEVTPKAQEKMVHVQANKTQRFKVFADPDKVHQILLNLIGNSLKFTHAEGTVSVDLFCDGNFVEVTVKDNGVGISKEDLSRLFKKFERLDNTYVAAATTSGTGLGLYISKRLVELMHGKIWVSSEGLGKGASFTFSLPVATPEMVIELNKYVKKPIGEVKELEPVSIL